MDIMFGIDSSVKMVKKGQNAMRKAQDQQHSELLNKLDGIAAMVERERERHSWNKFDKPPRSKTVWRVFL